jgi:hypothetical protein
VVIGRSALTLLALLYWYKSANTDAARMSPPSFSLSIPSLPYVYYTHCHRHTFIYILYIGDMSGADWNTAFVTLSLSYTHTHTHT